VVALLEAARDKAQRALGTLDQQHAAAQAAEMQQRLDRRHALIEAIKRTDKSVAGEFLAAFI
jgi:transcription elongation GreA/GreB family factor